MNKLDSRVYGKVSKTNWQSICLGSKMASGRQTKHVCLYEYFNIKIVSWCLFFDYFCFSNLIKTYSSPKIRIELNRTHSNQTNTATLFPGIWISNVWLDSHLSNNTVNTSHHIWNQRPSGFRKHSEIIVCFCAIKWSENLSTSLLCVYKVSSESLFNLCEFVKKLVANGILQTKILNKRKEQNKLELRKRQVNNCQKCLRDIFLKKVVKWN